MCAWVFQRKREYKITGVLIKIKYIHHKYFTGLLGVDHVKDDGQAVGDCGFDFRIFPLLHQKKPVIHNRNDDSLKNIYN